MSASPNSNASSSDLYSPTENPELVLAYPAKNSPPVREAMPSPVAEHIAYQSGHPSDQLREPASDNGHGMANGSQRDLAAGNPPLHALPNGRIHDVYPKRKRDEDDESYQGLQEQLVYSISAGDVQDSNRATGLQSVKNDEPPHKRQLFSEDWLKTKRSSAQESPFQVAGVGDRSPSPRLPDEIWQHIFSFVPPVFLGRLLRVNRIFHACLTKATGEPNRVMDSIRNATKPVSANSVWAASRKRFAPGLPKPLHGLQELEMWRLLRGRPCQMCGETKIQNFATSSESPLESGPGEKGVRVLWPVGIIASGSCLQECSEKVY